jgi:hypothetical protein
LRELNHGFDRTERPPNFSSELPRTYRPRPPAGAVARNVAFADSGIEVSGKPVETARARRLLEAWQSNAARNFTVRSARRLAGEPRAVDFRKEKKVDRRAIADLWTTNRLDTSLADSLTKNLKKNWFGQPNGRAGVTVSQTSA